MTVFAVIASTNAEKIHAAVTARYGANHFIFAPNTWFVSDVGTTKDVADKLGLTNGAVGALGVVISITGYSGWAAANAWTWLGQYPDARPNG